jgi:hypothetical protein
MRRRWRQLELAGDLSDRALPAVGGKARQNHQPVHQRLGDTSVRRRTQSRAKVTRSPQRTESVRKISRDAKLRQYIGHLRRRQDAQRSVFGHTGRFEHDRPGHDGNRAVARAGVQRPECCPRRILAAGMRGMWRGVTRREQTASRVLRGITDVIAPELILSARLANK